MRHLLLAVLIASLAACAADDARLPAVPAQAKDRARLVEGRHLFATRCSTCHALPASGACTAAVMDSMAPAAGLKPEERAAVEAYLAAVGK